MGANARHARDRRSGMHMSRMQVVHDRVEMALHPALGGIDVLGEDRLGDASMGAVDLLSAVCSSDAREL